MTDLEMTKLCAEAMDIPVRRWCAGQPNECWITLPPEAASYNPLGNDAQAMALVKKCQLFIMPEHEGLAWLVGDKDDHEQFQVSSDDLNRAIVECVAKMQQSRIYSKSAPGKTEKVA